MKRYKLTERENLCPQYDYTEEFGTLEDAQMRMRQMYHDIVIEGNPDYILNAELHANSAIAETSDGMVIEWDIEKL